VDPLSNRLVTPLHVAVGIYGPRSGFEIPAGARC
jgi:hypothetical protein